VISVLYSFSQSLDFKNQPYHEPAFRDVSLKAQDGPGEINRQGHLDMDKHKPNLDAFRRFGRKIIEHRKAEEHAKEPEKSLELQPAMPELGTAPCPVCGHRVAVFVTRTKRPFINCGFCSARIFYNGSRSMQLLKDQIEAPKKTGQFK
jgi:DNA-directed RNA polymerase subunit RPC12/RpoP